MLTCNHRHRRFSPEALKVSRFHGDTRAKRTKELFGNDIILTTYYTLSADWKRQRILQNLNWFRVVLDEGKSTNCIFSSMLSFLARSTEAQKGLTAKRMEQESRNME
jgi:SNF2 family DNA or RNA helicase